jgi:hypothetical protein
VRDGREPHSIYGSRPFFNNKNKNPQPKKTKNQKKKHIQQNGKPVKQQPKKKKK